MNIREAGPADEDAVCALWAQLISCYKKEVDPAILQRSFRYAVGNPGQVRIYVAESEGEVAGTASLHQGHYSTWNDNWYGHIEDVIVDQRCRRRGVGEALVRYITAAAAALGLSRLGLNALMDNMAAREMYEKVGFKTDSVAYEMPLNTRPRIPAK